MIKPNEVIIELKSIIEIFTNVLAKLLIKSVEYLNLILQCKLLKVIRVLKV